MKFQASEMVESPDVELVSRALETNLRAQWSDVARDGDAIVLRGLGPSHRVNRNDRAVFSIKSTDGGKTAIEVDATYLASALVGASTSQNEIVQRKFDGVLELVRMDVDLAQRRAALDGERKFKPQLVSKTSSPVAAEIAVTAVTAETLHSSIPEVAEVAPPAVEEVPGQTASVGNDIATVKIPASPSEETLQKVLERLAQREWPKPDPVQADDDIGDDIFSPKRADVVARRKAAMHAAQLAVEAASTVGETAEASGVVDKHRTTEQHLVHRAAETGNESEGAKKLKERSALMIFAVLLVTFLLAFLAQAGWQYRTQVIQKLGSWRAEMSGEQVVQSLPGSPHLSPEQQAAQQQAEREAAAADAEKAVEAARLSEPDPKKWIENWAETLKGMDAGAQAAYYADPVDKYFLRYNVSRADVMAARQDAISTRKSGWIQRLDDVVVAQQTDTTARILFVKYIASGEGTAITEQRLPTQIKLKRIDGQWRIVSEQTLG